MPRRRGINNSIEKFSKRKFFKLEIVNLILHENGIAYEIESEELLRLHKKMQNDLCMFLISL